MVAVAIDGPAGAGKSTIAKNAAHELGYIYVDTGAIYRTVALACLENHTDTSDEAAVETLLATLDISIVFFNGEQHLLLNDRDVSELIRTEEVSMKSSVVAQMPAVRKYLLDLQRGFAKTENVIMDGRDIGTVVLPDAQVKIFLTASAETRARRRVLQLAAQGIKEDYNKILKDITERDYNDTHREIAPLKQAEGSIIVDTSELTLEESQQKIIDIIRECVV